MMRVSHSFRKFVAMNIQVFSNSRAHRLILRACSLLTLLVLTSLSQHVIYAQQSVTLNCGKPDTINFGQILKGDSEEFPLTLVNKLGQADTLWSISGGLSYFRLTDSQASVTLGDSLKTNVILSALKLNSKPLSTTIKIDADSCSTQLFLQAEVIDSTADSTTFSLQNTSPEVIAIQSATDNTTRLFYLKNNSFSTITIDSIRINGTKAFILDSNSLKSLTLAPQDSFQVHITYNRSLQGFDNGYLVVSKPDNPILLELALQGVRTANDAVQIQPVVSTYFSLYPNPSYGSVTIYTENMTHANVTITDVLGRTVKTAPISGDWLWDRSGTNGAAPAETYFIIVTGIGSNGEAVHEVQRVVLE
jgi:hypothetical protein